MIAIISQTVYSGQNKTHVQLLGYGETEHDARIEAAHYTAGGFCPRAECEEVGYCGGEAVVICDALCKLLFKGKGWDDTFTEDGDLVASSSNDLHMQRLAALSRLYINPHGQLDACMQEQIK